MKTTHKQGESGASLIMVLVFVTFFGMVTSAILDFLNTGFDLSSGIVSVRDEQQAVDGAMEGAINGIRGSLTAGHIGNSCPAFVYEPPADSADPTVTVSCQPESARGGGVDDTAPKFAVLMLGDDETASDGDVCEGYAQRGNKTVNINGGIHSNSRIDVGSNSASCDSFDGGRNSKLNVDGDILALGPCTSHPGGGSTAGPKITATGDFDCDLDSSRHEDDPDYPAAAGGISGMPIDPQATCTSTASVVKFLPGVYTELPANHVPAVCSNNANSVWWFSPGVYYFDFPEATSLWDLWPQDGLPQPEQRAKSIVGGTPHGWSEVTRSSDVVFFTTNATTGAVTDRACDPGTENSPKPGVQFIFGGHSRLRTKSDNSSNFRGDLEVCAGDFAGDGTAQRIALYGLKNGTRTAETDRIQPDRVASLLFANPDRAASETDSNGVATVQLSGDEPASASLIIPGFGDINSGSLVSEATIDIRHSETGSASGTVSDDLVIGLKVTHSTGTTTFPVSASENSLGTTRIDLTDTLQEVFRYRDLNGISAELVFEASTLDASIVCIPGDASCAPSSAETIDIAVESVILEVRHTPPGFQAGTCSSTDTDCRLLETACATSGGCSTSSSENPMTVVEGTVYAPTAKMNLSIHNGGKTVFRRGVILRALDVDASASSTQPTTVPPFQLPGVSNARVVLFEASVGSDVKLRARVRYIDTDGTIDVPGHRVEVRRWTPLR